MQVQDKTNNSILDTALATFHVMIQNTNNSILDTALATFHVMIQNT
jgi:hypothetical protein